MKVLKKNSSNNSTKAEMASTNANNDYTIVNTNDIISNNNNNRSAKITWSNIRVELPIKKNTNFLSRFKKNNAEQENRKIIINNGI